MLDIVAFFDEIWSFHFCESLTYFHIICNTYTYVTSPQITQWCTQLIFISIFFSDIEFTLTYFVDRRHFKTLLLGNLNNSQINFWKIGGKNIKNKNHLNSFLSTKSIFCFDIIFSSYCPLKTKMKRWNLGLIDFPHNVFFTSFEI